MATSLRSLGYDLRGNDYSDTAVNYVNNHRDEEVDLADLVSEYDTLSEAFMEKGYVGFSDFFDFREEYDGEKI